VHGFKSQLATNSVKIKSPKAEVTELPMGICQISNLDKNMNKIQIFQNEQFGKVRITMNENDEPLFCLADVAKALGYSNPAKAVIDHCKGVTVLETPTQSGIQPIKYGKESEVYRLTMKSKLPNAEKFQDWVCDEVLPSIRKHGAYMTQETLEKALTSPDFLIRLATNLKEEKQKRIEAEQKAELAEQTIKSNAPKVLFADAVSTSQRSCLVAELAKILQQNGVNIGQNRLFTWMRENGYLCSKGQYYNQPTQKSMDLGLFELKQTTINKPDGSILVSTTTKVTGKGQVYFVNKFLGKDAA
jgi:anti-repressor protein